jgi:hypothetical protein
MPLGQRYRLIGVGLHNFREPGSDPGGEATQPELFDGETETERLDEAEPPAPDAR